MKANSLSSKGLSMSQAQSISNLCFQRTQDIANMLSGINNAEKTVKVGGETYTETVGVPMPKNVVKLLVEKSVLHAVQAFLMENIKAKDALIKAEQTKAFINPVEIPAAPKWEVANVIPSVNESWGWEQLSSSELNEYYEVEAYAAHIGQFIHKGCVLDVLRKELPTIKSLQWMEIKTGEKTPIKVTTHHTSEQLLSIHNELANIHRKYEQRVNYFKAKVKNLVTEENTRIAKANADNQAEINAKNANLRTDYKNAMSAYQETVLKLTQEFEAERQNNIKNIASLRINVDFRFQPVIDEYLKQVD